jgi:hypothetical protein
MSNSLPSINFVKNQQAPLFDRLMDWILTIGRLIVIITEVIAIGAFVYRFSLDEKITELHSEIKQKENIISVFKNDESKYRNLQDRIALAANSSAKGIKVSQTITDIVNLIPSQVIVNSLIFNKDKLNIGADVISAASLTSFINPLKNYPNIKSISIDDIENKPSVGLSVNISAAIK